MWRMMAFAALSYDTRMYCILLGAWLSLALSARTLLRLERGLRKLFVNPKTRHGYQQQSRSGAQDFGVRG
jgi:hypothetical protein